MRFISVLVDKSYQLISELALAVESKQNKYRLLLVDLLISHHPAYQLNQLKWECWCIYRDP